MKIIKNDMGHPHLLNNLKKVHQFKNFLKNKKRRGMKKPSGRVLNFILYVFLKVLMQIQSIII